MEPPGSPSSAVSDETSSYPESYTSNPTPGQRPSAETRRSTPTSSLAPVMVPHNTPANPSICTESDHESERAELDSTDHTLQRVSTALHLVDLTSTHPVSHSTRTASAPSLTTTPKSHGLTSPEAQSPRSPSHNHNATPSSPRNNNRRPSSHYHEFNTWSSFAEEDVANGLKRLARAAQDQHLIDPRTSVREYYSQALAKVLREAEVEFDVVQLGGRG